MLTASDAWSRSHSSQQPSKPEYHNVDWRIFGSSLWLTIHFSFFFESLKNYDAPSEKLCPYVHSTEFGPCHYRPVPSVVVGVQSQ